MTTSTIVGMFDEGWRARAAVSELANLGVSGSNITVTQSDHNKGYMAYQGIGDTSGHKVGHGVAGFFRRLFGSGATDADTNLYSEAVRRGTTVVTADVDPNVVDAAAEVFERHGAVDVDRLASRYRSTGYRTFDESAPIYTPEQSRREWDAAQSQEDVALPVVEEELQVGKRTVRRGGVRIHTRTTERPVDEVVTLREEHVRVERRPASRDATTQDLDGMQDRTIEVAERAEQAVVGKQPRVVEEVVVSKDVDQREEHVRDTVRRTDVEVEDADGDDTSTRNNHGRGAAL
jgi:uncharacterized protein (TIGR02271 family)